MKRITFALLILLLSNCSPGDDYVCHDFPPENQGINSESIFDDGIKLFLPEGIDDPVNGENILVFIENLTSNKIWIPRGYNLKIYRIIKEDQYEIILDNSNRESESEIILGPKGSESSIRLLIFNPQIPANGEETLMAISIYGHIIKEDQYCEEKIGGLLRFSINP